MYQRRLTKSCRIHLTTKLLVAEQIISIQFLVPFPRLDTKMHQQLTNLSLLLNISWH